MAGGKKRKREIRLTEAEMEPKTQDEEELERALFGGDFIQDEAADESESDPEAEVEAQAREGEGAELGDGGEGGGEGTDDEGEDEEDEEDDEREEDEEDEGSEEEEDASGEEGQGAGAWHDSDDDELDVRVDSVNRLRKLRRDEGEKVLTGTVYQQRLREQHRLLSRTDNSWINQQPLAGSDSEDEGTEASAALQRALQSSAPLTTESSSLPSTMIDILPLSDANMKAPQKAVVQSTEFHKDGSLLLSAGFDCRLRIFRVDGKKNPLTHTSVFKDLPVSHAEFNGPDHQKVVVSGRHRHFYCVDLGKGATMRLNTLHRRPEKSFTNFTASPRDNQLAFMPGSRNLVVTSPMTYQELFTLQASTAVSDARYTSDGLSMVTVGAEGLMHIFDLRMRRCRHVCQDMGSIATGALAFSPDGSLLATGGKSGVVNVYRYADVESKRAPKPLKEVMNITTNITGLRFHPKGQMLAMSSRATKTAFKLLQLPSMRVFKNWPNQRTPLNYVSTTAFSPSGGYMVIGNDKGRALLYRLKHYHVA